MKLIDTHAHIHGSFYKLDSATVLRDAKAAGVEKIICVGVDEKDSELAIKFAQNPGVYAAVGLHPHDAKLSEQALGKIEQLSSKDGVVAIGEIGIDYYYNHSSADQQKYALQEQIKIAESKNLPIIFHIRGSNDELSKAFSDTFEVYDSSKQMPAVVHSFSAGMEQLQMCLDRNLYVAVNGIATFTKNPDQIDAYRAIPDEKLLIETDTPFLTPVPNRGKINQPMYVELIAAKLAEIRNTSKTKIAEITSKNAENLFNI